MKCRFLVYTVDGERCAFMSVDEWRAMRRRIMEVCMAGGRTCPVLAKYYALAGNT